MKKLIPIFLFVLITVFASTSFGWIDANQFGIGLRAGTNRLQGNWGAPKLNPFVFGHMKYTLSPYVCIGTEFGYSELKSRKDFSNPPELPNFIDAKKFKTVIIPFEMDLNFNLNPLGKVNPFVVIGAGGVHWESRVDTMLVRNNKDQKGIDSFLKIGSGLEFRLNRNLTMSLGATYRYSLTNMLDQVYKSNDVYDGLIDAYVGLTYYFMSAPGNDDDMDGVANIIDLDSQRPEDADGYLDHDGQPELGPDLRAFLMEGELTDQETPQKPPLVIHHPIFVAEAGKDMKIAAEIYKKDELRVALVLFRIVGKTDWITRRLLRLEGDHFEAIIPGKYLTEEGLEYCVVAVDEKLLGVGYSGLPKRPIRITVKKNGNGWRILTGLTAAIGWGTAAYLLSEKQK